ncbi:unnamed protein product [Rhizoctonia solani]|uniref:Uncharacterized protein n=1 Tax=Rhizoctonia solani TaxID=456999 RepID=A0A8H2X520_9AGAM|nr:unnamed protein product [Rhizoctonia solani]
MPHGRKRTADSETVSTCTSCGCVCKPASAGLDQYSNANSSKSDAQIKPIKRLKVTPAGSCSSLSRSTISVPVPQSLSSMHIQPSPPKPSTLPASVPLANSTDTTSASGIIAPLNPVAQPNLEHVFSRFPSVKYKPSSQDVDCHLRLLGEAPEFNSLSQEQKDGVYLELALAMETDRNVLSMRRLARLVERECLRRGYD